MIQEFKTLPDSIRDWLASTEIVYLISQINRKLGLTGEKMRIVPALVYELVAKDVVPQNLISEVSRRLEIGPGAARILAQEIEERLLRQIEVPLRNELGIDIKGIYLSEEVSSVPELVKPMGTPPPFSYSSPSPAPIAPPPATPEEHNEGQEVMVRVIPTPPPTPPPPLRPFAPAQPLTPPIPRPLPPKPIPSRAPENASKVIPVQINVQKSPPFNNQNNR